MPLTLEDWKTAYKEMLGILPDVNKAVKDMYDAKRTLPLFPERYDEACRIYDKALQESRGIQAEFQARAMDAGICVGCLNNYGPNHFASSRCESGGHNHCSCDICF